MSVAVLAVLTAAATPALAGCGIVGGSPNTQPLDSISVKSPRFRDGAPLPADYSCKGKLGNPLLRVSGVPSKAKSLALVVDDDNSREGSTIHWVVFDIDPLTTELTEGGVPQDARQGQSSNGKVGYLAPCRPEDTYRFTVYALKTKLDLKEGAPLSETLQKIAENTIARGRLTAAHIE